MKLCYSHDNAGEISVTLASSALDVQRAMSLNGRIYERLYETHWAIPPDCFVMAELKGVVIATAGLLFAINHDVIPSERYFQLGSSVARFFAEERPRIAEVGRLTSTTTEGLKAVLNRVVLECRKRGIGYLVGWTSAAVREHLERNCGFNFQKLDAKLNLARALTDDSWVIKPTGFFVRDDAPELLMSVIPLHPDSRIGEDGRIAAQHGLSRVREAAE
jgi:hypothetical protein